MGSWVPQDACKGAAHGTSCGSLRTARLDGTQQEVGQRPLPAWNSALQAASSSQHTKPGAMHTLLSHDGGQREHTLTWTALRTLLRKQTWPSMTW